MATDTVQSTRWRCDRPDCTHEEIVENGGRPVGYTGEATRVEKDRGGRVVTAERVPWFSCKATHIRGAVDAVTSPGNDSPAQSPEPADSAQPGDNVSESDYADEPEPGSGETMVSAVSGTQSGERVGQAVE